MGRNREIRISSNLKELHKIESFVDEICNKYNLFDSYYGNIMVAVTEAVSNAIKHGNQEDEKKWVYVLFNERNEGIAFRVMDEGNGFEYTKYEDKEELLSDENLEGKGLILILSLADEVKFYNKGRVIDILFKITGIDPSVVEKRLNTMHTYFTVIKKAPINPLS